MSRTFFPERILEHMQGEARALLHDLRLGDPVVVRAFYLVDCEINSSRARLADAQYIIARKHGFKSWQYLKQHLFSQKSTAASFPLFLVTTKQVCDLGMDRQTPTSSETDTTFSIDPQEQIRRRAFEIYEQRGREDGHELDDWLQAEAEVVSHRSKATGATA